VSAGARIITPDSSVIIAGFATWHEQHAAALEALRGIHDLVAHAELETYSVLTRLPEPFQIGTPDMAVYLGRRYPGCRLSLSDADRHGLIDKLARLSISGGAVYDALVAVTADRHGRCLVSCDRRAARTYDRLGVDVVYLYP
jgi:predicted nucleic acid-binding protein